MEWLNKLSKHNIPFKTYKLNHGDAIIYNPLFQQNKCILIIHGLLYVQKTFNNKESLCIAILTDNTIINLHQFNSYQKLYYYQLVSLNISYLVSFRLCDIPLEDLENREILTSINSAYYKTISQYEEMVHILTHKYIKYRFIQLLLFLAKEKGSVVENQIVIELYMNQSIMGSIVGSNKNTIYSVINHLTEKRLIHCSVKNNTIYILDLIGLNQVKSII